MTSVTDWLTAFADMSRSGDGTGVSKAFVENGFWRDYLPFGWTLQTLEGQQAISGFAAEHGPSTDFRDVVFEGQPDDTQGFFRFQTKDGTGRGHIRMDDGLCTTLFTMLEKLHDNPYVQKLQTPNKQSSIKQSPEKQTPTSQTRNNSDAEPYVLIVGGGQGGLALGAQLKDLNVPYLIVDKYPRVGDQWRSRYESLVLHDPVWYDHLPFKPFPEDWPIFTPKDQMGDWLETYAAELKLNVSNNTTMVGAQYDEASNTWITKINKGGETRELRPKHIVLALGLSGFARTPEFSGQDIFKGPQFHSSEYKNGSKFAGKNVVIIGANNSAHDIASDLVRHHAKPTMIQRSSTLVVRQEDYCEKVLGPLYSVQALEQGITTEKADILQASMPIRLLEQRHRPIWDGIREEQSAFYNALTDAGFCLDFAEDGTGLGMKYRRTASGYYIDVGGSQMVMDGDIGVRSGSSVEHLSENAVHLSNGDAIPADAIYYATGYGNMTDWVSALIDADTAERVGPCWGYGSNTKGDPGPWLGELRNMWMPTAQKGLWFTGGNLSQARFCSRLLGLQLAKRFA